MVIWREWGFGWYYVNRLHKPKSLILGLSKGGVVKVGVWWLLHRHFLRSRRLLYGDLFRSRSQLFFDKNAYFWRSGCIFSEITTSFWSYWWFFDFKVRNNFLISDSFFGISEISFSWRGFLISGAFWWSWVPTFLRLWFYQLHFYD